MLFKITSCSKTVRIRKKNTVTILSSVLNITLALTENFPGGVVLIIMTSFDGLARFPVTKKIGNH